MPKAKKIRRLPSKNARGLSTGSTAQKTALVLGPTPERMAKSDYDTIGRDRRKSDTVKALSRSGDIGNEAVEAAGRWYVDYIMAAHGYQDCMKEMLPSDYERGNVHTYAISRGKSGARIALIRERLGLCAHTRLELMLAQELSFSAMARILFPKMGATATARTKVSAQCAIVLEALAATYREERRERALQKTLVAVGSN